MKFRKSSSQEQGRVRRAPVAAQRQTFSYYTQPSSHYSQRSVTDRRGPAAQESKTTPPKATHWVKYGVLWVCLVIVLVCLVKLLAIEPSSRIVMSGSGTAYTHTSEATYAKKADALLHDGLLNRIKITLDTNGIAQKMKQAFPELESVVVTVPIVGNRPIIYIAPAHPVMRLETAAGSYLLSSRGYAYTTDNATAQVASLPKLLDLSGVRPSSDVPFLPVSTVDSASTIYYQLSHANIPVDSLMLPQDAPYELDARLVGKPYTLRFNLEEDPVEQSGAAIAVIDQLGTTTPSSYIDVRVPGRAYYQ